MTRKQKTSIDKLVQAACNATLAIEHDKTVREHNLEAVRWSADYVKVHYAKELKILGLYTKGSLFIRKLHDDLLKVRYGS